MASSSISTSTGSTWSSTSPAAAGCAGATSNLPPRRGRGQEPAAAWGSSTTGRLRRHRAGHQEAAGGLRRPRPAGRPWHRPARAGPARARFTHEMLRRRSCGRRPDPDQGRARRPVGDRGDRQRLLRRDPARRGMSPFRPAASRSTTSDDALLYDAIRSTLARRGRALARPGRPRPEGEKKSGLRVHGRTGVPCPVCGDTVREVSFADSSPAVLPDLPDRG